MTRLVLLMLSVMVLLAACGGSVSDEAETTTTTDPTSAGAPPTDSQDTEDDVEEGAATGSDEGDACLNPVDEVSAAFGAEIVEAENSPSSGGEATCFYYTVAGGPDYALATSLLVGEGVQQAFSSYASDEGSEEVGGIGDQAVWASSYGIFIILKGDRVFSLSAGPEVSMANDPAAVRAILEELGRTAAGQL